MQEFARTCSFVSELHEGRSPTVACLTPRQVAGLNLTSEVALNLAKAAPHHHHIHFIKNSFVTWVIAEDFIFLKVSVALKDSGKLLSCMSWNHEALISCLSTGN